jgi:hypothetical protein
MGTGGLYLVGYIITQVKKIINPYIGRLLLRNTERMICRIYSNSR